MIDFIFKVITFIPLILGSIYAIIGIISSQHSIKVESFLIAIFFMLAIITDTLLKIANAL
jgi:hypothetical protein